MTKLFVETTDYNYQPPVDISLLKIHEWMNPIIVCARQGQKKRLVNLQRLGLIRNTIKVVGWWDLGGEAMESLFQYDAIFLLDPERISIPKVKEQWDRLISCLQR